MKTRCNLPKLKRQRDRYAKHVAAKYGQIQTFVGRIVEEIAPRKVILFGSYAKACATFDSDVDLLVVTDHPAGNDASLNLRRKIDYEFPLDLIVCDRNRLERRIEAGDFFLQEAIQTGRVLYESPDR